MTDEVVTAETLRGWPLPEPEASEKHSRGVALVVGGTAETPGAPRLAGEAALRSGCGKLRIVTVSDAAVPLAVQVPEARVYGVGGNGSGGISTASAERIAGIADSADATLIGPGFTEPRDAEELVAALVPAVRGPVVLDALATAYVGSHPDLSEVEGPCVLTVNPAELGHVLHLDAAEVQGDPRSAATRLAEASGAVVLLGGETKVVATPDGTALTVSAGGPGLATSGSGDVQAGLVLGLLARGADPAQAAVWAAWLHGQAGDRLARRHGPLGFLAGELAAEVPRLVAEVSAGEAVTEGRCSPPGEPAPRRSRRDR
jgi:ADP-dependent NAD(P)H-hydrate dehydratase